MSGDPPQQPQSQFLPGFSTADDFFKSSLKMIAGAISASNALPSAKKEDWAFYSTFPAFRQVMSAEKVSVQGLMDNLLRWNGVKGRCPRSPADLMDLLAEANDHILERINASLDEAAGLKRDPAPGLIQVSQRAGEGLMSGSWNNRRGNNKNRSNNDDDGEEDKGVRLVTAKSILRPQLGFADRIDNSAKSFVPSLTEKPNSKKPLSILVEYGEKGEEFYSHPYLYELNLFRPSEPRLLGAAEQEEEKAPPNLDQAQLVFVDTPEKLEEMIAQLKQEKEIAVDLEHHWYRSYQGIISLMQISTWEKDFIVDPFPLWHRLTVLNEVFTDPGIVKVFHGADNDLFWLQRDFSVYVVNMFDTHQAAIKLNVPQGCRKFSNLLMQYCKVRTDKSFQLADWRMRPLPKEMLEYARKDTRYLIHISRRMQAELRKAGNEFGNLVQAVVDSCTNMCKRVYFKPTVTEESHLDLVTKSRVNFNERQLFATKQIFQWRNREARKEDESEQYVLPNHMLLKICTELPREMQGILACCNPIPPLVKQSLQELHLIILKARDQPLIPSSKGNSTAAVTSNLATKCSLTELAEDPLKSPLDLAGIADLDGPTILDDKASPLNHGKVSAAKTAPFISVFAHGRRESAGHKAREPTISFLGPYLRYQRLMPYLKYLEQEENGTSGSSKDVSNVHADKIRSIREHFDALTAMTPAEYVAEGKDQGAEEKEEVPMEGEEEEEEVSYEVDSGVVRPLRPGKSDKNFSKKRKKQQNAFAEKYGGKKTRDEGGAASSQGAIKEETAPVNYECEDLRQFSKGGGASGGMSDKVYDPWKGYKQDAGRGGGRGKQKQKFKNRGRSTTYKM